MTDARRGARPGAAERASTALESAGKTPALIDLIGRQERQVERALPTHLKQNAAAYTRALVTLVKQTPELSECDPLTVLGGLMQASSLGLEFGSLGHCFLVPFRNHGRMEAQFQRGYKGTIDLAWRSGKLVSIAAREVCENDEFDFDLGLADSLHHKYDPRAERGAPYAWYGLAKFVGGGHHFVVLGRSDVEEHRRHSKTKDSEFSPWKTSYSKMACKSCIHEMTPYLPLTTEVLRDLAIDNVIARGTSIDDLVTESTDYIDADAIEDDEPANLREPIPEPDPRLAGVDQ